MYNFPNKVKAAVRGKLASPSFLEVGCANFQLCFSYQTKESRLSKNAVARRVEISEAEFPALPRGSRGGEKPQSSPSADGEIPIPKGAPKKVNCITVLWTVIQEENPCDRGIFLVRRPQTTPFKGARP